MNVISEPRMESIEIWSFIGPNGTTVSHVLRVDQGEKGQVLRNPIDQTPVQAELMFKSCDDKNETIGVLTFPLMNKFCYGVDFSKQRVYAKGESPLELEFKRRHEVEDARLAARRARFDQLRNDIGGEPRPTDFDKS